MRMPTRKQAGTVALAAGGVTLVGAAAGAAALAWGYDRWRRSRFELRGRVALVTGGSRGLGFAIARELLQRGCRVAICARDGEELERAAGKLQALGAVLPVVCDLTEPNSAVQAVTAVRREWGAVEVLVHNAGIMQIGPWETMSEADFERAMDLHCWAALRLARAVLPGMIARREGRIVNISSIGGLVAVPHMLPYTTSKFALVGLSQGLAAETRRHGVRVTCVSPFLMRTGSQERVHVKGNFEREFAWFAASGVVPGLSQSAGRAARAIVAAAQRGEAQVVLALPGKLAAWAHGVAPSTVAAAMGLAARVLPAAPPEATDRERMGSESYNATTARRLQPIVRRQGRNFNQSH